MRKKIMYSGTVNHMSTKHSGYLGGGVGATKYFLNGWPFTPPPS